mmetsp:Transcript_133433/g.198359  ORF Transcript_133433/g.198359 Transcript_133433/m.198359 type:complete len:282 (-) Transcript_133433:442-1287(-)
MSELMVLILVLFGASRTVYFLPAASSWAASVMVATAGTTYCFISSPYSASSAGVLGGAVCLEAHSLCTFWILAWTIGFSFSNFLSSATLSLLSAPLAFFVPSSLSIEMSILPTAFFMMSWYFCISCFDLGLGGWPYSSKNSFFALTILALTSGLLSRNFWRASLRGFESAAWAFMPVFASSLPSMIALRCLVMGRSTPCSTSLMRLVYFFFSETVVGMPSWVFIQSMCTWSSFLAKSGWSFLYSSSASFFACATISAVGLLLELFLAWCHSWCSDSVRLSQ